MRKNTVPGQQGPQYQVMTVTPELVEKWLDQNTHNRPIREKAVMAYARDMVARNWAENGEAIKFAKDGTLLDGQHRLHAVALSGVSVRMLVVTGLESQSQETMDDGRKRTLADALNLRGETNSVILGALLRRALMWDMGQYRNTGAHTPTNTECLTFLAEHPECRNSASVAATLRKPAALPASILALTHWAFTRIDTEDSRFFFERLGGGHGLPQYHPILALRKKAREVSEGPGRVPEDMLLAFVIKAWNAYRDGEEVRLLRFRPGGAQPEKFPTPK